MSHTNIAANAFAQTDIRQTFQRQVLSALWSTLAEPATRIMAAYTEWRRINRAIAELAALSDHVLADIGVPRHDIERIVRNGRDAVERHA